MENAEIRIFNTIPEAQVKEGHAFGKTIASLSKKALFLTSVPFYWLVFFTRIMHWFDTGFFVFVVAASMALSIYGKNWGLLEILLK